MPNPLLAEPAGDDAGFRRLGARLSRLEREIRDVRANAGSFGAVYNSSGVRITQGGSLTVDGGGTIAGTVGGKTFFSFDSATGTLQGTYLKIVDTDVSNTYLDVTRDVPGHGIRVAGWPSGGQLQFFASTFVTGPMSSSFSFGAWLRAGATDAAIVSAGGDATKDRTVFVNSYDGAVVSGGSLPGILRGTKAYVQALSGDVSITSSGGTVYLGGDVGTSMLSGGGGSVTVQANGTAMLKSVNSDAWVLSNTTIDVQAGADLNLWAHSQTSLALGANNRIWSASIRDNTTTAAANVVIDAADGTIRRSTSSERYKTDIRPLDVTPAAVLAMDPVTWTDDTVTGRVPGFTVEQVEAAVGDVVTYGGDSLMYDRITALHQIVLRDLDDRLTRLENS